MVLTGFSRCECEFSFPLVSDYHAFVSGCVWIPCDLPGWGRHSRERGRSEGFPFEVAAIIAIHDGLDFLADIRKQRRAEKPAATPPTTVAAGDPRGDAGAPVLFCVYSSAPQFGLNRRLLESKPNIPSA
jgi:hypothetical protein